MPRFGGGLRSRFQGCRKVNIQGLGLGYGMGFQGVRFSVLGFRVLRWVERAAPTKERWFRPACLPFA